jgi:adenylosuccinate lyase
MDIFNCVSPLDYRYYLADETLFQELNPYVSHAAQIAYQLKVELALVKAMAKLGICPPEVATEVEEAIKKITSEEILSEDKKIEHDIRALVRCIKEKISQTAEPYIHLFVTSADIVDTGNACRYKDLTNNVMIPKLIELEKILINLALREKKTLQIGRTHGKHAEPITFGFTMANYVDRLGKRITMLQEMGNRLPGQISGAVGSYNSFSIVGEQYNISPDQFEQEVLRQLGIKPGHISSQIVQPEPLTDLVYGVLSCFSVLANLSDDMRHLMRSELDEIDIIPKEKSIRVGSSTMPHKVNPWHFEHVKSMWKAFLPRIVTHMMDQISEHQRDLTNSASTRFISELFTGFIHCIARLNESLKKIEIKKDNMEKNLQMSKDYIIAEPLYTLLAINGFPSAYEYVKKVITQSRETETKFSDLIWKDKQLKPYLDKLTSVQKNILKNPEKYIGIATQKTSNVCKHWMEILQVS